MLRFTGTVDGVETLNRAFNRVEEYISDFRSIWPFVAKEFYAIEEGQFQSEGAKGLSGRWSPLSPAYAKYKEQKFPGQPLLRATTSLYQSMTSPDAPDSIFRMDERELTIGTKHEAATAHQRGTRKMSARPIISLTEDDKRRIQKSIQGALVPFIRRQGFEVLENVA